MLNIFLAVSQIFVDSDYSTALIREVDRTETDFSIVFCLISQSLYFVFSVPVIVNFYNIPLMESITKVVALTLIIGSLSCIHNAKYQLQSTSNQEQKYQL